MTGTNGTALPARRRDYCPDLRALLVLLEDATGIGRGSQRRLAELVGCSRTAMHTWLRGKRPVKSFRAKLTEIERSLKEGTFGRKERKLPLMANAVTVSVEGEQALVSFSLKVPGEESAREVAQLLVPKAILGRLTP